jgi:hypothetical protein
MRLVSWKPIAKGSLRSFATVELLTGLKLIDCPILIGRNGAWAGLPSKPVINRDGMQARPSGRPQFAAVQWRSRELNDRFSEAVVALIREAHPDALWGNQ